MYQKWYIVQTENILVPVTGFANSPRLRQNSVAPMPLLANSATNCRTSLRGPSLLYFDLLFWMHASTSAQVGFFRQVGWSDAYDQKTSGASLVSRQFWSSLLYENRSWQRRDHGHTGSHRLLRLERSTDCAITELTSVQNQRTLAGQSAVIRSFINLASSLRSRM